MKELLVNLVRESSSPGQGRNAAREYLQARVLACLQRHGAMVPLAFHGGVLKVALSDPPSPRRLDELRLFFNRQIEVVLAPEDDLVAVAVERLGLSHLEKFEGSRKIIEFQL